MNGCREFRQTIIRFFSGDLAENEEKLLNKHIRECGRCKKEFLFHKEMAFMLKNRPLSEAPESVIEKVLSLIPEKKLVYAKPYFNWRIILSISCVAVAWGIAVITIYFPPPLSFINIFVNKLILMIIKYLSLVKNPYFLIGVVAYSIVFSLSSIFFFWKTQVREAAFSRI